MKTNEIHFKVREVNRLMGIKVVYQDNDKKANSGE